MRRFIILAHTAPTHSDFSLDDLPGTGGRLDELCRCVSSAFFLSHAIRGRVQVYLVIRDELTIRFAGSQLKRLNPDERSTAALIRHALDRRNEAIGHRELETTPGVFLSNRDLRAVLEDQPRTSTLIQLHEEGQPIISMDRPENPVFVLSDHEEFSNSDLEILEQNDAKPIRVGPRSLHANHTIVIAHNWLDTAGYSRY